VNYLEPTVIELAANTLKVEIVTASCKRVAKILQELIAEEFKAKGHTLDPDPVHVRPRQKFIAIDIGTSGAWMVKKETGEIFNIQGYGRPDRNKKHKADLGNIMTVDAAFLLSKRYNYLR
jgi:hypothetical protein